MLDQQGQKTEVALVAFIGEIGMDMYVLFNDKPYRKLLILGIIQIVIIAVLVFGVLFGLWSHRYVGTIFLFVALCINILGLFSLLGQMNKIRIYYRKVALELYEAIRAERSEQ